MNSPLLALAAFAGVCGTAFALPSPVTPSTATSPSGMPVPLHVVHPTAIPICYENATVTLRMEIDEAGVPHFVRPYGWMPADLAERVVPAVRQWTFTPRVKDGRPVRVDVVLPLTLVNNGRG